MNPAQRHLPHQAFAEMVTQHPTMQALLRYAEAIARSPQPVLITGETGTGKELLARAIHRLAAPRGDFRRQWPRRSGVFRHPVGPRGGLTGADRPREGLITRAEDGTLFLDEMGDLAAVSQVKLLRLLQDGTYYPSADRPRQSRAGGGHQPGRGAGRTRRHVSQGPLLSLAGASCRDPTAAGSPGRSAAPDHPLPGQSSHGVLQARPHRAAGSLPAPPYLRLPGNVRELEAMVFDAVARHPGGSLALQAFKDAMESGRRLLVGEQGSAPALPSQSAWDAEPLPTLQEAENALIAAALRHADGNQAWLRACWCVAPGVE